MKPSWEVLRNILLLPNSEHGERHSIQTPLDIVVPTCDDQNCQSPPAVSLRLKHTQTEGRAPGVGRVEPKLSQFPPEAALHLGFLCELLIFFLLS